MILPCVRRSEVKPYHWTDKQRFTLAIRSGGVRNHASWIPLWRVIALMGLPSFRSALQAAAVSEEAEKTWRIMQEAETGWTGRDLAQARQKRISVPGSKAYSKGMRRVTICRENRIL